MFQFSPRPNKAHLIHWNEWGDEALQKAQKEDKPVYLSLSAVWCHWCHVFDETTLSDPQVIEILNRDFICIRVDADKNPHLQSRYLAGGWPTSAFLTPTGDMIVAGTYMYPEDFRSLAVKVSEYYKHKKGELYARMARSKIEKGFERERQRPVRVGLSEDIPKKVFTFIKESFDPIHGGFGTEPKFPQAEVIEFLIKEALFWERTTAAEGLEMARKCLDGMMQGELWDKVEKGFFRYCTRADWTAPHYEKMLENNAGLLKDYLLGYQATGNEPYRKIVEDILHYTGSRLHSPGGFYGSQDADEQYYHLDAEGRGKVPPPKVDECIYTDWNGQIISQYMLAYQSMGQKEALEKASVALNLLRERAYEGGNGMRHYIANGEKGLKGLLSDQVYTVEALLTAYQITARNEYLRWATSLMDYTVEALGDKARGGFFDVSEEGAANQHLSFREKPFRENTVAARVLIRLFYLTGREDYKKQAANTLRAFLDSYQDYSLQAAPYALAVREYLTYPIRIVIIGKASDPQTLALHQAALQAGGQGGLPWKVIRLLDPATEPLELGRLTFPRRESPTAYVCQEGTCSPPLSHPVDIKKILTRE